MCSEAQRTGHRGARQRRAGDTEISGTAPVITPKDSELQSWGHEELKTIGQGTARHWNLGQGIPRVSEA